MYNLIDDDTDTDSLQFVDIDPETGALLKKFDGYGSNSDSESD